MLLHWEMSLFCTTNRTVCHSAGCIIHPFTTTLLKQLTLLQISKFNCWQTYTYYRPNYFTFTSVFSYYSAHYSNSRLSARSPYRAVKRVPKLRKTTISDYMSVCLSVCPFAWNNSAPTRRSLVTFDTWRFFENLSIKFKFYLNLTRIAGVSHV
jgi:hypothetical protein